MHRLVGGYVVDPQTCADVARFRKSERSRLYALRKAMPLTARRQAEAEISEGLDRVLPAVTGLSIAVYWPIRGEPDLRNWMSSVAERGAKVLLPHVIHKDAPLRFLHWRPGAAMRRGAWNILEPDTEEEGLPQVVVSPLLGWDAQGFRLGNGGGYYDRTLAALSPVPRIIGVGFAEAEMPTIFPMPWDVKMDGLVLSDGRLIGFG
jgi:5,10-methenyltetrahydrofolate synthetase